MAPKSFEPHGDIELVWQDNLLLIYLRGPFNLEGTLKTNASIASVVEDSAPTVWARVEIFDNDDVLGPYDTRDMIQDNIHHSLRNGCKLIAVVKCHNMARTMFEEFANALKIDVQFFDDLDQAKAFARRYIQQF